jgi:hypothetical protein
MANRKDAIERFTGYVRLGALDVPFISKAQERALLSDGIAKFGLTEDEARGILLGVAQSNDLRVERDIDARIRSVLDRYGGKRHKISRRRFREASAIYKGMAGGALSDEAAAARVKRVMEANGFRAKRAGLLMSRRWYRKVDRAPKGGRGLAPVLGDGARDV